jgi:hypothetical protein
MDLIRKNMILYSKIPAGESKHVRVAGADGTLNGRKVSKKALINDLSKPEIQAMITEYIQTAGSKDLQRVQRNLNLLKNYAETKNSSLWTKIKAVFTKKTLSPIVNEAIIQQVDLAIKKPQFFSVLQNLIKLLDRQIESAEKQGPITIQSEKVPFRGEAFGTFSKEQKEDPLAHLDFFKNPERFTQQQICSYIKIILIRTPSELLQKIHNLNIHEVDLSNEQEAINKYKMIFQSMPKKEKNLCTNVAFLMHKIFKAYLKKVAKGGTEMEQMQTMTKSMPFVKALYEKGFDEAKLSEGSPHAAFIFLHAGEIFSAK